MSASDEDTAQFLQKWIAWNGETDTFYPAVDEPTKFIDLTNTPLSIVFSAFMTDEAGEKHTWQGGWPGLDVEDSLFGYPLGYSLGQSVSVPQSRDIFIHPLHPLGYELGGYSAGTDDWVADSEIDLGNAPPVFPQTKTIELAEGAELSSIDWLTLYSDVEADTAYGFECHISDLSGDTPNCEHETDWVGCDTVTMDTEGWVQAAIDVRYADLPSIDCGRVVVTRESAVQGPCDFVDCEDGQVCIGEGECVAAVPVEISIAWNEQERDRQFIVMGEEAFTGALSFRVESALQNITALSTPQLVAVNSSADGTTLGEPIPGTSCSWVSAPPGLQLYVDCEVAGGDVGALENSMVALSIEYSLEDHDGAAISNHQKFRVLGLAESTSTPMILQALPAFGSVSKESDIVQLWVQLGYHQAQGESGGSTELRLEATIAQADGTTSVAVIDTPYLTNIEWFLESEGTVSRWVLLELNRGNYAELFPGAGVLSLTLSRPGDDEVWSEVDQLSGGFGFSDSTPTFIGHDEGLHFPADYPVLGRSPDIELPMRGLGPNRGGYVVHIGAQVGEGIGSDDPNRDPSIFLGLSVSGGHQLNVMSKVRSELGLAGAPTSDQALTSIESVQPTQPASLAFNQLFVDNVEIGPVHQLVSYSLLGSLKRLLWDPVEQRLIVVGENGMEFFTANQSADQALSFSGAVELGSESIVTLPGQGQPCSGKILDATMGYTLAANGAWESEVALLVLPNTEEPTVQHCTYFKQTATFSQLSFTNIADGQGGCGSSLSTDELVFAYNPMNRSYWLLSGQCLVGYNTLDTENMFGINLISAVPIGGSVSDQSPSSLTIEPHSGVAIAKYLQNGSPRYKRFVLGSDVRQTPLGSPVAQRTGMVYDAFRGWTWEVAGLGDANGGSPAWYWMPSVGELSVGDSEQSLVEGLGISHMVMDASRDVIYSLKFEYRGNDGFVVTQEVNEIAEDVSNISLRAVGTQLYRSYDSPSDIDGDGLTDFDETVFGTGVDEVTTSWSAANLPGINQPVIGMVLMGPQVVAGLPPEISVGDILTIQGSGFTGDVSRDEVCVQGVCVAPIASTPTSVTFRVPQVFTSLDSSLRAYVTVFDGHRMSGPVPGESKLVPIAPYWRGENVSSPSFGCTAFGGACIGGGFIQTISDTYLSVYDGASSSAYRVDTDTGALSTIESTNFSMDLGLSSVSPLGSGMTLGLGQGTGGTPLFYEARGTAPMGEFADLPAQNFWSSDLAASRSSSVSQPIRFNNQTLEDTYFDAKILVSPDLGDVALGNQIDAANTIQGWAGFKRHVRQPASAPDILPDADDSRVVAMLPGLGGFAHAPTAGAIQIETISFVNGSESMDVSSLCGWGEVELFNLQTASAQHMIIGAAVLAQSPLQLGVIKLNRDSTESQWETHCATQQFENVSTLETGGLHSAMASNGAYFATGVQSNGLFELYVWETQGSKFKLIHKTSVEYGMIGLEFSGSGKELYVLGYSNLTVLKFNKSPVE